MVQGKGENGARTERTAQETGPAPENEGVQAAPVVPKRPRGRPRKHPLPGGTPPVPQESRSVPEVSRVEGGTTTPLTQVAARRPRGRPRKATAHDGTPGSPDGGGGNAPGMSGGPRAPSSQAANGAPGPRRRGRRKKAAPSILNPFCPDCGTYLRMFRPPRGRWRKVCPRCEPERMIIKRDYRDYIDKTGMPCKDRGKCRPERCVKALDCEEMARFR